MDNLLKAHTLGRVRGLEPRTGQENNQSRRQFPLDLRFQQSNALANGHRALPARSSPRQRRSASAGFGGAARFAPVLGEEL